VAQVDDEGGEDNERQPDATRVEAQRDELGGPAKTISDIPMAAAGVSARSPLIASAPKIMPNGIAPIIIGIVSLAPLANWPKAVAGLCMYVVIGCSQALRARILRTKAKALYRLRSPGNGDIIGIFGCIGNSFIKLLDVHIISL